MGEGDHLLSPCGDPGNAGTPDVPGLHEGRGWAEKLKVEMGEEKAGGTDSWTSPFDSAQGATCCRG